MTLFEHIDIAAIQQAATSNDDFSIPLCMDDIISICKDFSQLGNQVQTKIEDMLELGVEEAIGSGKVDQKYLPYVKFFLSKITENPFFGEARDQAQDCLRSIYLFETTHKDSKESILN
jgi:hypothetical protein